MHHKDAPVAYLKKLKWNLVIFTKPMKQTGSSETQTGKTVGWLRGFPLQQPCFNLMIL